MIWYSGLSKIMMCVMERTHDKIVRSLLNATPMFHVGANKMKVVGLLSVEYKIE